MIGILRKLAKVIASLTRSSISILDARYKAVAGTFARKASTTEFLPDRTSKLSEALVIRRPFLAAAPATPAVFGPDATNSPLRETLTPVALFLSADFLALKALWPLRSSALGVGPLPSSFLRPWPPVPTFGPFLPLAAPGRIGLLGI